VAGAKLVVAGAVLLFAAVLQSTLLAGLTPGVQPDLLLALAVGVGLTSGPLAGGAAGLFGGLAADLLTGRLVGLGTVTKGAAGLLSGVLGRRLFGENFLVPFVVGAIATFADQVLFLAGARAFGVSIPFWHSLTGVLVPVAWYNGLLTALCFPLICGIHRRLTYGD
jgi:rod shape-determining protein MreD